MAGGRMRIEVDIIAVVISTTNSTARRIHARAEAREVYKREKETRRTEVGELRYSLVGSSGRKSGKVAAGGAGGGVGSSRNILTVLGLFCFDVLLHMKCRALAPPVC